MRRWAWLLGLALVGAAAPAYADSKNEKEIKIEEVPAPARQALLREAGGAPIVKVEEEKTDKGVLYEAHIKKATEVLEVKVDAAGKVLEKKTEKKQKK